MQTQKAALTDIEPQWQVTADDGEGSSSASSPADKRLGAAASFSRLFVRGLSSFSRLFNTFESPELGSTRSLPCPHPYCIVLRAPHPPSSTHLAYAIIKMLACRSGAYSRPVGQQSSRATLHPTTRTAAPPPLRRAVPPTRAQQTDEPQPPPPQQPAAAAAQKPPPPSPQSVVEEGSTGGLAKGQGTAIVTGAISLIFGFAYLVSVL